MYICNCRGITEREIRGAVELGCATLRDLQRELGVATCCGKCLPQASGLLRSCGGCAEAAFCARAAGD
jgi:bacterioferritin-associated ferredoxin